MSIACLAGQDSELNPLQCQQQKQNTCEIIEISDKLNKIAELRDDREAKPMRSQKKKKSYLNTRPEQ